MNLNDYQTQAMSFRLPTADAEYALLNLPSEVGEFFGHAAKYIRDNDDTKENGEILRQLLLKELGDILWDITAIASDLDSSLDEIASGNIQKLAGRKERGTLHGNGDSR